MLNKLQTDQKRSSFPQQSQPVLVAPQTIASQAADNHASPNNSQAAAGFAPNQQVASSQQQLQSTSATAGTTSTSQQQQSHSSTISNQQATSQKVAQNPTNVSSSTSNQQSHHQIQLIRATHYSYFPGGNPLQQHHDLANKTTCPNSGDPSQNNSSSISAVAKRSAAKKRGKGAAGVVQQGVFGSSATKAPQKTPSASSVVGGNPFERRESSIQANMQPNNTATLTREASDRNSNPQQVVSSGTTARNTYTSQFSGQSPLISSGPPCPAQQNPNQQPALVSSSTSQSVNNQQSTGRNTHSQWAPGNSINSTNPAPPQTTSSKPLVNNVGISQNLAASSKAVADVESNGTQQQVQQQDRGIGGVSQTAGKMNLSNNTATQSTENPNPNQNSINTNTAATHSNNPFDHQHLNSLILPGVTSLVVKNKSTNKGCGQGQGGNERKSLPPAVAFEIPLAKPQLISGRQSGGPPFKMMSRGGNVGNNVRVGPKGGKILSCGGLGVIGLPLSQSIDQQNNNQSQAYHHAEEAGEKSPEGVIKSSQQQQVASQQSQAQQSIQHIQSVVNASERQKGSIFHSNQEQNTATNCQQQLSSGHHSVYGSLRKHILAKGQHCALNIEQSANIASQTQQDQTECGGGPQQSQQTSHTTTNSANTTRGISSIKRANSLNKSKIGSVFKQNTATSANSHVKASNSGSRQQQAVQAQSQLQTSSQGGMGVGGVPHIKKQTYQKSIQIQNFEYQSATSATPSLPAGIQGATPNPSHPADLQTNQPAQQSQTSKSGKLSKLEQSAARSRHKSYNTGLLGRGGKNIKPSTSKVPSFELHQSQQQQPQPQSSKNSSNLNDSGMGGSGGNTTSNNTTHTPTTLTNNTNITSLQLPPANSSQVEDQQYFNLLPQPLVKQGNSAALTQTQQSTVNNKSGGEESSLLLQTSSNTVSAQQREPQYKTSQIASRRVSLGPFQARNQIKLHPNILGPTQNLQHQPTTGAGGPFTTQHPPGLQLGSNQRLLPNPNNLDQLPMTCQNNRSSAGPALEQTSVKKLKLMVGAPITPLSPAKQTPLTSRKQARRLISTQIGNSPVPVGKPTTKPTSTSIAHQNQNLGNNKIQRRFGPESRKQQSHLIMRGDQVPPTHQLRPQKIPIMAQVQAQGTTTNSNATADILLNQEKAPLNLNTHGQNTFGGSQFVQQSGAGTGVGANAVPNTVGGPIETVATSEVKRESKKHRQLKMIIRQNKHIQQITQHAHLACSSFDSQQQNLDDGINSGVQTTSSAILKTTQKVGDPSSQDLIFAEAAEEFIQDSNQQLVAYHHNKDVSVNNHESNQASRKVQQLQADLRREQEREQSSSSGDLSRDERYGQSECMVINQGYTPSAVMGQSSASGSKKLDNSSQKKQQINQECGQKDTRREKKEMRKTSSPLLVKRISMSDLKEDLKQNDLKLTQIVEQQEIIVEQSQPVQLMPLMGGNPASPEIQESSKKDDSVKMHPIFGKNKEKAIEKHLREKKNESRNLSKYQKSRKSSETSSFQRTFNKLLCESEGLQWQFNEILRRQLASEHEIYITFVQQVLALNQEKKQNFYNSTPLQGRRRDFDPLLIENKFTKIKLQQHIEFEKDRMIRSENLRLVHSDMSGKFLSNSVRQSLNSLTSPLNFSYNARNDMTYAAANRRPTPINQIHSQRRRHRRHLSLSFARRSNQKAKSTGFDCVFASLAPGGFKIANISQCTPDQSVKTPPIGRGAAAPGSKKYNLFRVDYLQEATNKVQIISPLDQQKAAVQRMHQQQQSQLKQQVVSATSRQQAGVKLSENNPAQKGADFPKSLHQIYDKVNKDEIGHESKLKTSSQLIVGINAPNSDLIRMKQRVDLLMNKAEVCNQLLKPENNFFDHPSQKHRQASPNQIFGKVIEWQEGKLIGQGTTGEVYEAINIESGEMFVVKKIRLVHPFQGLDQNKSRAVKKEIDRYKTLEHKYIVRYFGCEVVDQNVFCVYLEYLAGGSIQDMYREYGKISETMSRKYITQVLEALIYLHSKDVIHGDLKGANVLLTREGTEIKLCDLGNSLQFDPEVSLTSVKSLINGTLAWMSPETHNSKVGKKSDIWSLGCLLVEMLTGDNPWGNRLDEEGGGAAIVIQKALQRNERPNIPGDVSKECHDFIDRCLQHSYFERPYAKDLLEHPWIKNNGISS